MDAFDAAVTLVPNDAGSWFNLGNAADKLADYDRAAKAFRQALEFDPADPAAEYNLANAHKARGSTEEAIHHYRRSIAATPRDADKRANLGYTLDAAGRHTEAAVAFGSALAINGRDAAVYTGLGHCLKSSSDMGGAAAAYRHALSLEPQSASAYAGLGGALKDSDPKTAAEAFAFSRAADEELAKQAGIVQAWLEATPQPARSEARPSPRYPAIFEAGSRCAEMTMAEAVLKGSEALLRAGPVKLTNASAGWRAHGWTDEQLTDDVGDSPLQMLAMPQPVHPTLDPTNDALLEPSLHGVYFRDYLALLDRLASSSEFAVYLAQLNLLKLPKLLSQVRHHLLLAPCSLLLAPCSLLLASCYMLHALATCHLLHATCHLPIVTRTACYLLLATCYLRLATCYLLRVLRALAGVPANSAPQRKDDNG